MPNLLFRLRDTIIFFSRGPISMNITTIKADIERYCNPEIK